MMALPISLLNDCFFLYSGIQDSTASFTFAWTAATLEAGSASVKPGDSDDMLNFWYNKG